MPQPTLVDSLEIEIRAARMEIADIHGKAQSAQNKAEDRIALLSRRLNTLERALNDVRARGWELPVIPDA